MKRAFVASSLFVLSCWAACNTRSSIGSLDPDGGSPGVAGGGPAAGSTGIAGVVGNTAGTGDFAGSFGGAGNSGVAGNPGFAGVGAGGGNVVCPSKPPASNLFLGTTPIAYPSDSVPSSVALGDLNGDGVADVVVGGFAVIPPPMPNDGGAGSPGAGGTSGALRGSVEVAFADHANAFAPSVRYGGLSPGLLGLADLNGDKLTDVVSVSYAGPITLLNTGAGALGAPTTYSVANPVQDFATADLDGDGKAEMLFSTFPNFGGDQGGLVVLKSAGGSAFAAQTYDLGFDPMAVAVGELDGHAGLDVVVVGDKGVHVFSNDGSGHLAGPASFSNPLHSVALADVDGDGKLDIVGSDASVGGYSVLMNLGGSDFSVPRKLPFGDSIAFGNSGGRTIAFGDLDGDGKVDAVVSSAACSAFVVYLNDGKGSFAAPTYVQGDEPPVGFALGDVNGDKALDLVFFTATSVGVRLHRAP